MLAQAPGFHSLSDTLSDLTAEGEPIVVGTADLKYSNGLVRYQERFPKRFVQFGISEQNMVSAAAGMSTVGLKPFVATFASFMSLLCVEQMRTDTAYTNLPVKLIGHHAGFALGFYGASHHATEDLAITRSMANMTVLAPADSRQLSALLRLTVNLKGPVYIRIGRGREPDVYSPQELEGVQIGRAIVHSIGSDITLIATGSMVHPAKQAVERLRSEGFGAGLVDMHTIKPIDVGTLQTVVRQTKAILSIEEHNTLGGLGSAIAEEIAQLGTAVPVVRHGIYDQYVPVAPPTHLYRHFELDSDGIYSKAKRTIKGVAEQWP